MKKILGKSFLLLLSCMFALGMLSGCGNKSGSTIDEPEITGEYLTEEYSQQLLTDGAETLLGYVSIDKQGEDSYSAHIEEQEVVPSSSYDEGYYIADTNISKDVPLGLDVRIACFHDGEYVVETPDQFIEKHGEDKTRLFTVYLMGDSAELFVYTDPKDVMTK